MIKFIIYVIIWIIVLIALINPELATKILFFISEKVLEFFINLNQ